MKASVWHRPDNSLTLPQFVRHKLDHREPAHVVSELHESCIVLQFVDLESIAVIPPRLSTLLDDRSSVVVKAPLQLREHLSRHDTSKHDVATLSVAAGRSLDTS